MDRNLIAKCSLNAIDITAKQECNLQFALGLQLKWGLFVLSLTQDRKVVGSVPIQDKCLGDEHDYFFGVIYV